MNHASGIAPAAGFAAALALVGLAGCGVAPPSRSMVCASATGPAITTDAAFRVKTARLSVLTYNIEGLGWPARSGRGPQLREIGERLAQMRKAGTGPDLVLIQEMFSGAAKHAVAATGYPAQVSGPRRTERGESITDAPLPGKRSIKRGEIGIRAQGSGLAVLSRYPVIEVRTHAYGRRSCAGYDCLANKGVMFARIVMPGVPAPVDVYNTHLNAQGASRVPLERHLAAHQRQAEEASKFIDETHDDAYPVVFGGDFNMRGSEARWEHFTRYQSLLLVHRVCADPASRCDVRMSWDGDAPWMDTQDLQFYYGGATVAIRPIRVEAMFDGSPSSPTLSDHDGFLVTYELSWPESAPVPNACG